jgi:hypothetical protein
VAVGRKQSFILPPAIATAVQGTFIWKPSKRMTHFLIVLVLLFPSATQGLVHIDEGIHLLLFGFNQFKF